MRDLIQMTLIFTLILCLPFNSVAIIDSSNQVEVEIIVDATSKSVQSGEEAIFYWEINNNNSLYTVEITVDAIGDKTYFSQDQFVLKPGENMKINQYCPTLPRDEDQSNYTYTVIWAGTYYIGPLIQYTGPVGSQDLMVVVFNENQTDQFNGDLTNFGNNQTPIFGWVSVGIIFFIGIIIIIYWKIFLNCKKK